LSFSGIVESVGIGYGVAMSDDFDDAVPTWMESTAMAAPVLLGTAAGILLGESMHKGARRGVALGLGVLGVGALLPFVVGGVSFLIVGPRSKVGVKRRIQRIRDAGDGNSAAGAAMIGDEVDAQLREQGVI
jgi:hypothetical protein